MRKPLPLFVGLRYLRARKGSGFVSFVSAASVLGVSLGVATLIVVLSVMNGFENELRGRLLGFTSHASISAEDGLQAWPRLVKELTADPDVIGAAPFIDLEAMLSGPTGLAGAQISGIEPNLERDVSRVADNMLVGSLSDLRPGSNNIILGRVLAQSIGVAVGERISVLVPQATAGGQNVDSRLVGFQVSGIFELGVLDHDSIRAMMHLSDAADLGGLDDSVTGVRIETTDIFIAPELVRERVQALADAGTFSNLRVVDWTQQNSSYFRAVKIEKMMMALLLSLIIGVAAFNIVATLVMVVTEKRSGIAILRTLGCSRGDIIAVFVLQGTLIGWLGALTGVVLGVSMALNIGTLAPAVERLFGFQFMPADLYYLTSLPAELHYSDVLFTAIAVLVVTALATIYPALRAASVHPAEVLRYE